MIALIRLVNLLGLLLLFYLPYDYWTSQTQWEETVYNVKVAEIQSKTNELAAKTEQVKKAEAFKAQRDSKLQALRALRLAVDEQAKLVPKKANIRDVLKSLADRADTTGLEFSSFRPELERRQRFLVLTPVKVKMSGTYTQVMSFLDSAANMERAVTTESLTLNTPTSPKGGASLVTANATVIAFHLDEQAMANDTGAGAPAAAAVDPNKKAGK